MPGEQQELVNRPPPSSEPFERLAVKAQDFSDAGLKVTRAWDVDLHL